jgi:hypothetical protein
MNIEENLNKLNVMINEIKGLACVTRACLQDRKNFDEATGKLIESAKNISDEIGKLKKYTQTMNKRFEKLDKIYDYLKNKSDVKIE